MVMTTGLVRIAPLLSGLLILACATDPKRLVLSDEMRPAPATRSAGATSGSAGPASAPGDAVPDRYVIRLAENGRVWELNLPRDSGGYELRVPLSDSHVPETLTQADREMASDAPAAKAPPEGASPGEASRQPSLEARAEVPRSLLVGLASISELYRQHRYELALVQAVDLEKAYPDEFRLHLMKGSLYRHLGKPTLARDAYQKALELNPTDVTVVEALRELTEQEER